MISIPESNESSNYSSHNQNQMNSINYSFLNQSKFLFIEIQREITFQPSLSCFVF